MTNLNTPELQGALDCLAMLLLQPEAENAVQAIPFAAEALLILGKDTLPQDSQENRPLNPLNCRKPMRGCFWEQAK